MISEIKRTKCFFWIREDSLAPHLAIWPLYVPKLLPPSKLTAYSFPLYFYITDGIFALNSVKTVNINEKRIEPAIPQMFPASKLTTKWILANI